nr:glycosyltransferase family 39 protein [Candidatus Omnitrophota bacterium]
GSLISWDECLYAQVAREILINHNWIDLTWMGLPWSDKPPLYMWVTAVMFKLFGVNEFSARFFSAFCGVGTVIVVYLFAAKLYSRRAGIAAAVMFLSTWHVLWFAKMASLDMAFTFFIALSLLFFKLGEERDQYLFLSVLAVGCAFFTKWIGASLAPIIIVTYLFITKKLSLLKKPAFLWGVVLVFVVLAWWHGIELLHYGKGFVKDYFVKHMFVRTTQALDGHTGNAFTYFEVIPNKGRPWGGFGLLAVLAAFGSLLFRKDRRHLLPLLWVVAVLLTVSMVQTKLHWYILGIYPALAIVLGWAASSLFKKYTVPLVLALALSSTIYLSIDRKVFNLDFIPETKRLALSVKRVLPPGEKVVFYGLGDPGMVFYLGDVLISANDDLFERVVRTSGSFIALEKNFLANLAAVKYAIVAENNDFVVIKTLQ